ncbi:MAG: 5'/3'-nucleotidase SurE [Thermodesulfobacteriota bacterium]
MTDKKTILISNDDGIRSEGILVLAGELSALGTVYIVAPDRERSAASHSLTLHRPLRVEEIGERMYSVDGTPTDCVTLAIGGILPVKPDIVVSGINKGENLGEDTLYSGTVSAAMEGTIFDIPSMAVSLVARENFDFTEAARFSRVLAERILAGGLPPDTLLNVNVPAIKDIKGHKVTSLGKRSYTGDIIEKTDPRGKKYYWLGGDMERWEGGEDSDFHVVHDGFISITPLHLDLTNHASLKELRTWKF